MRLVLVPLLGLGLLATHACSRTTVMAADPGRVVPILSGAQIYYDEQSGIQDSVRMVITDQTTYGAIWEQATANQTSPPPRPPIDFEREMLVVVGAGRMNPGDQIRVDSAGVRRGFFVAVVRTIIECEDFPSDSHPLQIIRVGRATEPPVFEEKREPAAHCR